MGEKAIITERKESRLHEPMAGFLIRIFSRIGPIDPYNMHEYDALNERVKSAEAIRRFAEQAMRGEDDRSRTKARTHGQEL